METKTVNTPCGNVTGLTTDYGAFFRGIKYAEASRFGMPVEVTSYDDYQATEQGACCPQMRAYWNEEHRFYYKEFRAGTDFHYDEDCLYLDIRQPTDAKDCPVVIFIHGGSFTGGSINERHFDGSAYAKRGVIFVAVNYRLNVFGFFADGENCGGNLGLYDQYTAVEWVRHNIQSFGGNPHNITLIGQSAGAMSIQTLISSDMLDGKISGAVMLSGGGERKVMLPVSKPNVRYWKKLQKICGAKSFEELRQMPAEKLWTGWKTKLPIYKALCTKPVIDGKLVKNDSIKTDIPVVLGTVKQDLLPPLLNHMARSLARKYSRRGVPCFVYSFNHLLPPDAASFHSCDLWYALGSLGSSAREMKKEDIELSDKMVDMLCSFAKIQNPNCFSDCEWPAYESRRDIMNF